MTKPPLNKREFDSLLAVVTALRGENGCPWDREQTHKSLAKFAIEEVFELVEAIDRLDQNPSADPQLKSELGDVLFQVVLHSELARQEERFDIFDVIESLNEKMIRRHPHVFSDVKVRDSQEVIANWQKIKAAEKSDPKERKESYLHTPKGLPSLMEAEKIGSKTKKVGFDWTQVSEVLKKVKEEIGEVEEVLARKTHRPEDHQDLFSEIGDLLFSVAQLARHLKMDPEEALRKTNQRFRSRFEKMISLSGNLESFISLSSEEKEKLWEEAKKNEKR